MVAAIVMNRDYSLTGPGTDSARASGLVDAEWYRPPIDPARLRVLTDRTNRRAAIDTTIWLALLVGTGTVGWFALGTWWAVPAFAAYGALHGGSSDARWHEMGHGTAFRTRWLNDAVYVLASFMIVRGPTLWRWSHTRHHTDTIVVGRDPEIAAVRPSSRLRLIGLFLGYPNVTSLFVRTVKHAFGRLDADARDFVPQAEWPRVIREARAFVAVWLVVLAAAVATRSVVPVLYVGLPSIYGVWLMVFFGLTQHAGLREDVLDHRLNTRTVRMNPIFRFLYLNMNYHVEHHLFPTVPYRALPALHREVAPHLAPPVRNTAAAYRELLGAMRRQSRDPRWEIPDRPVPAADVGDRVRIDVGVEMWRPSGAGAVESDGHDVDLGPAADLAVGAMRRVDFGGATYVLCNAADDGYRLTDGLCTHGRTHLADGLLIGTELECPKHNGRFDVCTGVATRRPATVAIGVYPVSVVDGRLRADLTTDHLEGSTATP